MKINELANLAQEARVSTEPKELTQVKSTDLPGLLGKGAFNSLIKHPWMSDWSAFDKAWKHGVSRAGFHIVEMYPYMRDTHTVSGGIRPEHKLVFSISHFGPSGKVIQVQKWYRPKEPNEAEKRFGPSAGWTHVKDWKKQEIDEMRLQDFQIHDTPKLDAILAKCCELVLEKQAQDPDQWGMVGACLLDMDNRAVYGVNYATDDGKRVHAERAALENYTAKYGEPEPGCIIITTLSPCSEPMDERYGESCTDLINTLDIHKVYCGYQDATQDNTHKQFHVRVTRNPKLNLICKKFAETFLGEQP